MNVDRTKRYVLFVSFKNYITIIYNQADLLELNLGQ